MKTFEERQIRIYKDSCTKTAVVRARRANEYRAVEEKKKQRKAKVDIDNAKERGRRDNIRQ